MPLSVRFGGSEGTRSARAGGASGMPGAALQPFVGRAGEKAHEFEKMKLGSELGREEFEFRLTTKQKAEEDKLRDALDELRRSEDFTEEEKGEAARMLQAKMLGIQPLPHRKEKFDFEKNIYTDPETKKRFYISPKGGRPFEIGSEGRKALTPELKTKIWEKAVESGFDTVTGTTNWEKVQEKYDQAIQMIGGGMQQGGGTMGMGGIEGVEGMEGMSEEEQRKKIAIRDYSMDPSTEKYFMRWHPGPGKEESSQFRLDETPKFPFTDPGTGEQFKEKGKKAVKQVAKTGDALLDQAYAIGKEMEGKLTSKSVDPLKVGKGLLTTGREYTSELKELTWVTTNYEIAIRQNDFTGITKYSKLLSEYIKKYQTGRSSAIAKAKK